MNKVAFAPRERNRRVVVKVEMVLSDRSSATPKELAQFVDDQFAYALSGHDWDTSDVVSINVSGAREQRDPNDNFVPIADVLGTNVIHEQSAAVIAKACRKVEEEIGECSPCRALELICADWLSGA